MSTKLPCRSAEPEGNSKHHGSLKTANYRHRPRACIAGDLCQLGGDKCRMLETSKSEINCPFPDWNTDRLLATFFMHLCFMKNIWRRRAFVHYLPVFGCIATGIIYGALGVIAILSFLKIVDGGADENSFLARLHESTLGIIFIWILLSGTLSYIVWRIYEVIRDPYGYGKNVKGIVKRTGIALSTIPDILIAYAALQVIMGTANFEVQGQPSSERQLVGTMLQWQAGPSLVVSIGCILCFSAVVQFLYGVTQGYRERTDIDHLLSHSMKIAIHWLAWIGYSARGFILGITGFFLIKAGVLKESHYVVNTDKAFDFIGDDVGHVFFILTAIGTIAYGLFMLLMGITYDHDKD